MNRWVTSTVYFSVWVLLGLLIPTLGRAQTPPVSSTPTAASLISDIRQKYNVQIVGQLCTPAQTTNTSCSGDGVSLIDVDPRADVGRSVWVVDNQSPQTTSIASATFTTSGVHSVTLTRTYSVTSAVPGNPTPVVSTSAVPVSFTVQVGERPQPFQDWKPEHIICKGTELVLNPYPGGAPADVTYLWFPDGRTTPTYSVTEGGCYSVEVFNAFGCSTQQRTQVELCPTQAGSPGSKWYFGSNAGLDFAGSSPSPLTDGKVNTAEGVASISNTKGQLLFYTDGITVFDKDGNPMRLFNPVSGSLTNPAALGGNSRSTQSALIVPKPICNGCDYQYYVYTTQEINGTRQLTYSIVDMRRNAGKGAVIDQNIPASPVSSTITSTERSAAVRRDRDTTYWVITHDYSSSCFRVNHLTASGSGVLSSTATCVGLPHDSPARGQGQMKIGPAPASGTATSGSSNTAVRPMAVVVAGNPDDPDPAKRINYVELFTFNTETGELAGPTKTLNLGPAPPTTYGVEFSPDGTKLFVTSLGSTSTVNGVPDTQIGESTIVQYDLSESDPTSASLVLESSTIRQYGSLQVGPDGKIYVAVQGASSLGVIENPNNSGTVSNTATSPFSPVSFTLNGQDLAGKQSQLGLPNQVANFNEQSSNAGVSIDNVCVGEPIEASYTPICPKLENKFSLVVRNTATNAVVYTSPGSTTATSEKLPPLPPGSYSATVTNVATNTAAASGPEVCTVVTSDASFSVTAYPDDINLGADITRCGGREPIVLDMKITAGFYAWVKGNRVVARTRTLSLDPTNPASAGRYIAYATEDPNSDCFKSDEINVIIYAPGNLNVPPLTPLCQGSKTTLTVPAATGFQNFTWTSGNTTLNDRTITVDRPGTYTVTGSYDRTTPTGPLTCIASTTTTVVSAPLPTITPSLVQPTSCTLANGSITVTPAPTSVVSGTPTISNSFTYSWTTVSGTPIATTGNSASALAEGTYQVSVTDANACSVVAPFTLQSNVPRLQLALTPSIQQCGDPTSGSIALGVSNGTAVEVRWTGPPGSSFVSTSASLTGISAGAYSVSATNAAGCVSSGSATVGLSTSATLRLSDRSNCVGDTVQLIPSRLGNFTSGIVYRWNTGETTERISPRTAGTYSLTATNTLNGCVGTASATARFVAKPTISAGNNLSLCLGSPQSLTLLQLTGASPGGGTWAGAGVTPGGSFTANPALTGSVVTLTYSVTVDGCANSAPRQVSLNQVPQIEAGPDVSFCEGAAQTVRATGSPGSLFRWNDGTQGSLLRPSQTGRYIVTATLNGCEASDALQVQVQPAPRFDLTREAYICVGDRQQTQLRVVPQTADQTVLWTPSNTTSTTLTVGAAGTYAVMVTGVNGCTATATSRVLDRCEPRVFAPNAFSPNGDSNNDRFGAINAYTLELELRVYNRWGEVIFASTPETPDWDGTYRGEPAQSMLYPYTISYRSEYFPERPTIVKRGSVLLLR